MAQNNGGCVRVYQSKLKHSLQIRTPNNTKMTAKKYRTRFTHAALQYIQYRPAAEKVHARCTFMHMQHRDGTSSRCEKSESENIKTATTKNDYGSNEQKIIFQIALLPHTYCVCSEDESEVIVCCSSPADSLMYNTPRYTLPVALENRFLCTHTYS